MTFSLVILLAFHGSLSLALASSNILLHANISGYRLGAFSKSQIFSKTVQQQNYPPTGFSSIYLTKDNKRFLTP